MQYTDMFIKLVNLNSKNEATLLQAVLSLPLQLSFFLSLSVSFLNWSVTLSRLKNIQDRV